MGTIKQGILGGFNGKVGTVVGASWKGIAYMRGQAQSVRNPKTAAQVMQRNFFAQLTSLASQLSDDQLRSLFPQSVKGKTRRNLLHSQLSACAVTDDGVKSIDLSQLEGIGNGEKINSPMLTTEILEMGGPDGFSIGFIIEYDDLKAIDKPADANFIIVAYNVTKGRIGIFNTPYTGTDFNIDAQTKGWGDIGDTVRFYITYAASGENVSMRGFGSFIIKTRKAKTGRDISKGGDRTSNGNGDGNGDGDDNPFSINPITPPRHDDLPISSGDGDGDGDGDNDGNDGNGGFPTPSFHSDEYDY